MTVNQQLFIKALIDDVIRERCKKRRVKSNTEANWNYYTKQLGVNSIDLDKLDTPKEIWKFFVFHAMQTGGKGAVSEYEKLPPNGITLNPEKIMEGLLKIKKCSAFADISRKCMYTKRIANSKKTFPTETCGTYPDGQCPVIIATNEIGRFASIGKLLCEVMRRLLPYGGDLNKYYHNILEKNKGNSTMAVSRIFQDLISIKYLGGGKRIGYFLAVLGCPNDGIMHWKIDHSMPELAPVDVHTERLSKRFGFVGESATCKDIQLKLKALYPKEPRKLDFALYALGSHQELNICGKHRDCNQCERKLPRVFQLCPAKCAC